MKFILVSFTAAFLASSALAQSPASAPAAESSPVAAAVSKTASPVPPEIPLRDFFKNPVSRGYDLSPDGKMLSFLQPWESRMNISFARPRAGKRSA